MKAFAITGLLILSLHCFGQNDTDSTGFIKFKEGLRYYQEGNLDSALLVWTEIVDKRIGTKYDIYGCSFFNIPTLYWQLKEYDKAKEWYKKVLSSELKDNEETGSIMEPHTNYKHKSAVALASLYRRDSNYTEVLHWLDLADTVYRYWGFEGSATNVCESQESLLEMKTDAYLKMDSNNQAIRAIIIELICAGHYEEFFSKSENKLIELVNNVSFRPEFDNAFNHLTIIEKDTNNWMACFSLYGLIYNIPISNIFPDWNIPHYWRIYFIENNTTPDKKEFIEYVKNRSFYKRLTK